MYPVKFKPISINKPWGSNNWNEFLEKDFSQDNLIGESWEVSGYRGANNKISIVENGYWENKNIYEVLEDVYEKKYQKIFPILVKFLNISNRWLSIQVHPDGNYIKEKEIGGNGKTECWYVVNAFDNAQVACGLKDGVDSHDFLRSLNDGSILDELQVFDIKEDDLIFIPAGTIHTIKNALIYEVQQTSDSTYRLYDWGGGRELHLADAMQVINFSNHYPWYLRRAEIVNEVNSVVNLLACDYWQLDRIILHNSMLFNIPKGYFHILTNLGGNVRIIVNNTQYSLNLGETVFLLDNINNYILKNDSNIDMKLLRSVALL